MLSYFLTCTFPDDRSLPQSAIPFLIQARDLPASVLGGLVFTPGAADDRYAQEERCPPLMAELYFDDISALEDALTENGVERWLGTALDGSGNAPPLAACTISEQAMISRAIAVPEGARALAPGEEGFSYVVGYEGPAEDLNAWLSFYITSHGALLAQLPDVRQVEICTRADWCSPHRPGWERETHMLRNRVSFDDGPSLTRALHSPVRDALRRDGQLFPSYSGSSPHFPMRSFAIIPPGA